MKDIIQEIREGKQESFKEFFDDFYPVLCSYAKKYVIATDKSEDMAQEALIKYWERRENFNDIREVKNFLYVVTRNQCLTLLKRSKKDQDLELIKTLESESFLKANIIDQETFHLVQKAVSSLPERQKQIILLTLQGVKNPEIAQNLDITENTVKTLKRNAFRKLRELLKDNYYLLLFL
ncbi:RNA polymerase sigma factor [Robertkochia solimangrovi]|uniref:RNA polymerase sigma factor n=1 Tax=Robertkochia solimangrovi TaxID=2213046 RepID=UPI00117DC3AD|nr:sigma-70 family RNA polymerase sigma factor [Robertkochia solimangrovi]TRZ42243.1 RNA polymerase sigma-70 factor [Robertkochia solimangrovi]